MKPFIVLIFALFLLSTCAVRDGTVDPDVCSDPNFKNAGHKISDILSRFDNINSPSPDPLIQALNLTIYEKSEGQCEVELVQRNIADRNATGLLVWEFELKIGYLALYKVPQKPTKTSPGEN